MTLRMADGPVANLPPGMNAYAGYTDLSGIGVTWPAVQALPAAYHLSISVHGQAPAMCGDVEGGALTTWKGYDYGYCSLGNVGNALRNAGRPRKLWVAHYTLTPHICSQQLCDPTLHLTAAAGWVADGTQWTDHGGRWDESLLADDFFAPATLPIPPAVPLGKDTTMFVAISTGQTPTGKPSTIAAGDVYLVTETRKYGLYEGADQAALEAAFGKAVPLSSWLLEAMPGT